MRSAALLLWLWLHTACATSPSPTTAVCEDVSTYWATSCSAHGGTCYSTNASCVLAGGADYKHDGCGSDSLCGCCYSYPSRTPTPLPTPAPSTLPTPAPSHVCAHDATSFDVNGTNITVIKPVEFDFDLYATAYKEECVPSGDVFVDNRHTP